MPLVPGNQTVVGGGLSSPVTIDPLEFQGAVTFDKHITVKNNDSLPSTVTGFLNTAKVFVLKAAAAQSANIFETQDSSGNPYVTVTSAGDLTMSKSTNQITLGASGATLTGTPNEIDTGICFFVFNGQPYFNGDAAHAPRWGAAALNQLTVGAAGAAAALPATPSKYLRVIDSAGTAMVIPAYAQA